MVYTYCKSKVLVRDMNHMMAKHHVQVTVHVEFSKILGVKTCRSACPSSSHVSSASGNAPYISICSLFLTSHALIIHDSSQLESGVA